MEYTCFNLINNSAIFPNQYLVTFQLSNFFSFFVTTASFLLVCLFFVCFGFIFFFVNAKVDQHSITKPLSLVKFCHLRLYFLSSAGNPLSLKYFGNNFAVYEPNYVYHVIPEKMSVAFWKLDLDKCN